MNKKGFIISDYIITLLVITMLFNIMVQSFTIINRYDFLNQRIQDELMIYHLRKTMLLSEDLEISDNRLNFNYKSEPWHIYMAKDKLILGDGVQVLLDKITSTKFIVDNKILYIEYVRNNKLYKRGIKKDVK